jgi:Eco57I restriction-modification methylase
MSFNHKIAKKYLQNFDFLSLFIESMGWDNVDMSPIYLTFDQQDYQLEAIAEKCGMKVFCCTSEILPLYQLRRKIDKEITAYSYEHLIIYIDSAQKEQIWQWVKREKNKPLASREQRFYVQQSNDLFLQKLADLAFSLEEEASLSLLEVTKRTRKAFDADKVTKKFYDDFKKQHSQFLSFISGIENVNDCEWYASLMLNRLMFIYFMQKKGFFDQNKNYLEDKLKSCQNSQENNQFFSFYRSFLLRLFHEGLGNSQRSPELTQLLGQVPYLNGGLYEKHQLEEQNPDISIPDQAFENIFTFFKKYDWHLDDRTLKNQNEINPDVLGYIFEKYTNQKQMGAYYTKEDITEYISKNCIIPYLFESTFTAKNLALTPNSSPTFEGEKWIFTLLQKDSDRYIYESVKHGIDLPLPAEIDRGITDVCQRENWNKPAAENYALPTETWREHINRRQRYFDLIDKITNNEITSINDFITYNLSIRQFIQDVIENCHNPKIIWQFYQKLSKITILDPTCGSGAFLFAALNILEPIYEVCLQQMQIFIDDHSLDESHILENFQEVIKQINAHNNRSYFILKSIMINNLYGVDIMQEATEICKLRLYLKLASKIEPDYKKPNLGIEPLPDIDFNIRFGNTLVGFANYEEVKKAVSGDDQYKLDLFDNMQNLEQKAQRVSDIYQEFRKLQENIGDFHGSLSNTKEMLKRSLSELNDELNRYLGREYGIKISDLEQLEKWRISHQPFHWFVEFYDIIHRGGFDVIIGNPPYVEYSKVKKQYILNNNFYQTLDSGNIYAQVLERSIFITNKSSYVGWIVPISSICTDRTKSLQEIIKNHKLIYAASFDIFPSRIFEGAAQRLTILLLNNSLKTSRFYLTKYYRWWQDERENLINTLTYEGNHKYIKTGWIARIGTEITRAILDKISSHEPIKKYLVKSSNQPIYVHRIINNFIKAIDFKPYLKKADGTITHSDDFKVLNCQDKYINMIICLLNSNLFYFYWRLHGDGFHCGFKDLEKFPCNLEQISKINQQKLDDLSKKLNEDFKINSEIRTRKQVNTGLIELQTFFISKSKPIIDEIDKILAQHYGFTEEELDFIINYDIKYRMGKEIEEEE